MSSPVTIPTRGMLQSWSNDPAAARDNLRSIFAALSEENLVDWAVEVLENCGPPRPSDLAILAEAIESLNDDAPYWACKLIARLKPEGEELQMHLCRLLANESAPIAARQEAAIALAAVGSLTMETRAGLDEATRSRDPRLARLAAQALKAIP